MIAPLLEVDRLTVELAVPSGHVRVVDDVSFSILPGRTLAVVGESGSGKSMAALGLMRLLPAAARLSGVVRFEGQDTSRLAERELCAIRGRRMAMIFQEPMTSLNPVLSIGQQVAEPLERCFGKAEAWRAAVAALRRVGIPDAERRARGFPHQLSGGMRQRVMIAMALIASPTLLIADEPTTALDVTIQAQILALLVELQRQNGMGMLLITHDLGVVAEAADDVLVMYAGRIVERAPVAELFAAPRHPYTQMLLRCSQVGPASLAGDDGLLPVIPGEPPAPGRWPGGCVFQPRCGLGAGDARCSTLPQPLIACGARQAVACWKGAAPVALPAASG